MLGGDDTMKSRSQLRSDPIDAQYHQEDSKHQI